MAEVKINIDDLNWSDWVEGNTPEPNPVRNWFKRCKITTQVLPNKRSGIYQIGVWDQNSFTFTILYIGKSTNVRNRIFSQYCLNGSHIARYLRPYLEDEMQSLYFRWALMPDHLCDEYENAFLARFNFPINSSNNDPRDNHHREDVNGRQLNEEDDSDEEEEEEKVDPIAEEMQAIADRIRALKLNGAPLNRFIAGILTKL